MKSLFFFWLVIISTQISMAQNVGIGTTTPNNSALLQIESNNKGVLFPRLTTSQRNTISNPAHGLHVFNTDLESLEFYDSAFKVWTAYCSDCAGFRDTITADVFNYVLPPGASSAKKILIVIQPNVYVFNSLSLQNAPAGARIIIKNFGSIIGRSGGGGMGGGRSISSECTNLNGSPGSAGGDAVSSKTGTFLTIYNYGIIGGGGGGGGGGAFGISSNPDITGGGGGGGQGFSSAGGFKGNPVAYFSLLPPIVPPACNLLSSGQGLNGSAGTLTTIGIGGNGAIANPINVSAYKGGNGGSLGSPGQPGDGDVNFFLYGGAGGLPGKAVSGNAGNNTIINLSGGVVYGIVE